MNPNILAMHAVEGRTFTPDQLFNCCTRLAEPDWSQFNALEVGGCINDADEDEDGTHIIGGQERSAAEFFTVYGRDHEGLVEAITDADDFESIMEIARHLQGRSGLMITVAC